MHAWVLWNSRERVQPGCLVICGDLQSSRQTACWTVFCRRFYDGNTPFCAWKPQKWIFPDGRRICGLQVMSRILEIVPVSIPSIPRRDPSPETNHLKNRERLWGYICSFLHSWRPPLQLYFGCCTDLALKFIPTIFCGCVHFVQALWALCDCDINKEKKNNNKTKNWRKKTFQRRKGGWNTSFV